MCIIIKSIFLKVDSNVNRFENLGYWGWFCLEYIKYTKLILIYKNKIEI